MLELSFLGNCIKGFGILREEENDQLGEDATGLKFWNEIGYSVSAFMMDGLNVIIVLWNVVTLMPRSQH